MGDEETAEKEGERDKVEKITWKVNDAKGPKEEKQRIKRKHILSQLIYQTGSRSFKFACDFVELIRDNRPSVTD